MKTGAAIARFTRATGTILQNLSAKAFFARALVVLLVAGLVLASIPFFASFSPSERSISSGPRVSIPDLAPRQFAFVEDPLTSNQWPSKLLLLRHTNGELRAWSIPLRNGVIAMPDKHWWRADILCPSFAPDFASGVIACTDARLPPWWREHLRWTLEGKSLTGEMDDMPRVAGEERSGEFIYSMRRE